MIVSPRVAVLTDLLLGAAFADERLAGDEKTAVSRHLLEIVGADELPIGLEARIENFDPDDFDLAETAKAFERDPVVNKRRLLELVASVFDADGVVDFAEDDYLRHLASALGMDESEYGDLVIEYDVEDVHEIAEIVIALPPPVPDDA